MYAVTLTVDERQYLEDVLINTHDSDEDAQVGWDVFAKVYKAVEV